jgi:3D (Asp-Asp-Asp) domain-containing protein
MSLAIILILATYNQGQNHNQCGYKSPTIGNKTMPNEQKNNESGHEMAQNVRETSANTPELETSRGGLKSFTVIATAYTHTGNRTKTGTWPKAGRTVAVDHDVIPLGSKVWIDGYGWRIAEDTGGVINGNKIDLFLDTEEECWQFGRRELKVFVSEPCLKGW